MNLRHCSHNRIRQLTTIPGNADATMQGQQNSQGRGRGGRFSPGLVPLKRGRGAGGVQNTSAAAKLTIPAPVNLPSLKKENAGLDPNTQLVPATGGGWLKAEEPPPAPQPSQAAEASPIPTGSTWGSAQSRSAAAPWQAPDSAGPPAAPVPYSVRSATDRRRLNPSEYPTLETAGTKSALVAQLSATRAPVSALLGPSGPDVSNRNWDDDDRVAPPRAPPTHYPGYSGSRLLDDDRSGYGRPDFSEERPPLFGRRQEEVPNYLKPAESTPRPPSPAVAPEPPSAASQPTEPTSAAEPAPHSDREGRTSWRPEDGGSGDVSLSSDSARPNGPTRQEPQRFDRDPVQPQHQHQHQQQHLPQRNDQAAQRSGSASWRGSGDPQRGEGAAPRGDPGRDGGFGGRGFDDRQPQQQSQGGRPGGWGDDRDIQQQRRRYDERGSGGFDGQRRPYDSGTGPSSRHYNDRGGGQRGQYGRDGPQRGRYQERPAGSSAFVGSSALLGAPMPSDLVMGSGGGGRSKSSQEESGGGHEDENGVDDSAAFNAELDRIAAEKEQRKKQKEEEEAAAARAAIEAQEAELAAIAAAEAAEAARKAELAEIERRSTPEARAAALAAKKAAEAEAEARRIAAAQAKLEELNARIAAKEAEKKAEEERKAAEQAAAARAKAEADAAEAAMKAADEEAEAAKAAAAAKAEAEASAKRQPPPPPPPPQQQQQQQQQPSPPVKPASSPPPAVNAWAKPLSLGPAPTHGRAPHPTAPQALPAQDEPAEASKSQGPAEDPEAHASAVLEAATPADPPPNAWASRVDGASEEQDVAEARPMEGRRGSRGSRGGGGQSSAPRDIAGAGDRQQHGQGQSGLRSSPKEGRGPRSKRRGGKAPGRTLPIPLPTRDFLASATSPPATAAAAAPQPTAGAAVGAGHLPSAAAEVPRSGPAGAASHPPQQPAALGQAALMSQPQQLPPATRASSSSADASSGHVGSALAGLVLEDAPSLPRSMAPLSRPALDPVVPASRASSIAGSAITRPGSAQRAAAPGPAISGMNEMPALPADFPLDSTSSLPQQGGQGHPSQQPQPLPQLPPGTGLQQQQANGPQPNYAAQQQQQAQHPLLGQGGFGVYQQQQQPQQRMQPGMGHQQQHLLQQQPQQQQQQQQAMPGFGSPGFGFGSSFGGFNGPPTSGAALWQQPPPPPHHHQVQHQHAPPALPPAVPPPPPPQQQQQGYLQQPQQQLAQHQQPYAPQQHGGHHLQQPLHQGQTLPNFDGFYSGGGFSGAPQHPQSLQQLPPQQTQAPQPGHRGSGPATSGGSPTPQFGSFGSGLGNGTGSAFGGFGQTAFVPTGKQPDWSVTPTGGGGSGSLAGAPSREAAEAFARGGSGALAGGNQGAGMVLQRPGSGAGSTQFAAPGAQQGSFVAPGRLPGQPQSGQGFYAQGQHSSLGNPLLRGHVGSGSFGNVLSATDATLPDDILGGLEDGSGMQRRAVGGVPPQQRGKGGRGGRGAPQGASSHQGGPMGQQYPGAPHMRGGSGGPGRGTIRGPSPGRGPGRGHPGRGGPPGGVPPDVGGRGGRGPAGGMRGGRGSGPRSGSPASMKPAYSGGGRSSFLAPPSNFPLGQQHMGGDS